MHIQLKIWGSVLCVGALPALSCLKTQKLLWSSMKVKISRIRALPFNTLKYTVYLKFAFPFHLYMFMKIQTYEVMNEMNTENLHM